MVIFTRSLCLNCIHFKLVNGFIIISCTWFVEWGGYWNHFRNMMRGGTTWVSSILITKRISLMFTSLLTASNNWIIHNKKQEFENVDVLGILTFSYWDRNYYNCKSPNPSVLNMREAKHLRPIGNRIGTVIKTLWFSSLVTVFSLLSPTPKLLRPFETQWTA